MAKVRFVTAPARNFPVAMFVGGDTGRDMWHAPAATGDWTAMDERQLRAAQRGAHVVLPQQPGHATVLPWFCKLGECPECDHQRHLRWGSDFRRRLRRVARAWANEQEAKILAKARLAKRKPHCRVCGEITTLRVGLWPGSRTIPEVLHMDLVVSGIRCTYCDHRVAKYAIVTAANLLGDYTV